jgi:hypothetical protein
MPRGGSDVAVSTQPKAGGTVVVSSEAQLNAAIVAINNGGDDTTIDVRQGFTLTADVTAVAASMTITSSNGSAINDGGNAFLTVTNGAIVSVGLNAGGSGVNVVDGGGNGSAIIGLTGGTLANLSLENGGGLTVAAGQRFATGGINANSFAGITLGGVLDNSEPIVAFQATITTTATGAQANDIWLQEESFLTIASNTAFKARRVTVGLIAQIAASGNANATLDNSEELLVLGQTVMNEPGSLYGVNVRNVTLQSLGRFTCIQPPSATTPGCNAAVVKNKGGHFNAGQGGTWNVASYEQSDGRLILTLPDFTGAAPLVNVSGKVDCTGGEIQVWSQLQYVAKPITNKEITLVVAAGGLNLANTPVKFMAFPTGISPGLSITNKGIAIKLTILTPP